MNEHDATSVIGQIAGLTTGDKPKRVPPSALIARFCNQAAAAGLTTAHGPRRESASNMNVSHGFCGFLGGKGDSMVTGFDEGYSFMGYLEEHGWRVLPAKGDWPYVIYMRWMPVPANLGDVVVTALPGEPETLIEYCEADLTVWQFDAYTDLLKFYATLRNIP